MTTLTDLDEIAEALVTTSSDQQKEGAMPAPTATFTATVSAVDFAEAVAKIGRRLPDGFVVIGEPTWRSQRHLLVEVEVQGPANRRAVDNCWVMLTSYGVTPGAELGSSWQVAGLV